MLKPGPCYIH